MINRNAVLLSLFVLLGATPAKASHILGGEILWDCQGNDQYIITLNLFRDCSGITLGISENVTFSSPCGSTSLTVSQLSVTEVSQLCPADLVNSTCNGGSLPGIEQWTYTGILTLPPCDTWTMTWSSCCRSPGSLNLADPDLGDLYTAVTLNTADHPCDDPPAFTDQPIPYVCLNQPASYGFSAIDPDGDSLSYEFISAMGAGGVPFTYAPGYSYLQPIPGITLDPVSGLVTFIPTLQGSFVVVVMVTEYDDQGNVIGTVMRDITVIVIACSNNTPDPASGVITNLTGGGTQAGPYAVELCGSDQFCFDFSINDPNSPDVLSLSTNVGTVLPGSTFSYSGTNPITGTICWTVPGGATGPIVFSITVQDDACPVFGQQTYLYTINVLERTVAGTDATICGSMPAQLEAQHGTVFNWSVLTGDPIIVGVNFSCNPCNDPIADPSITTTYVVVSDLQGACVDTDTVTVFVVPDFTFTTTQSDVLVCLGGQVQFDVAVNPNVPGYGYAWSPGTGLSATNIPNPTGIYSTPGILVYLLEVTSPDGCPKVDTLSVTVAGAFPPAFTATQDDLQVPCNGSTQFHVTLDGVLLTSCAVDPVPCFADNTIDMATDSLFGSPTFYPAPFGHFYEGARHQVLYRASELQAMGFNGGGINALGFNVESVNGTSQYFEWSIKMGCTTLNELDTAWIAGLSEVFYTDTLNITTGWNIFQFPSPFGWDGASNLVIEVCFNNDAYLPSYTQNSPTYHSVTAYNSVHWINQDQNPLICTSTAPLSQVSANRPNVRLAICSAVDPDNITYTWTPTNGLSDPASPDPIVTPPGSPTTYVVTVTDTTTNCSADTSLTVTFSTGEYSAIGASTTGGTAPLYVDFNSTSSGGLSGFVWAVDGTTFGNGPTTNYTFNVDGTYVVTLTGVDGGGCTYTSAVVITVGVVAVAETSKPGLHVYPDPADDEMNVELGNAAAIGPVHFVDLLGRTLTAPIVRERSGSLLRLDVSGIPSGTYLLAIGTSRGNRTALVVVAH